MVNNFWHKLAKPIVGLAPMDGVTDEPFRFIQKKYGQPDVMFTEFTSVEGVCHGATQLLRDFIYDESERPLIAQIYGSTPDYFRQTAILLCELGFDGIDINMGCPAKNVAHSGAGAALIKTPELAQKIVRATKTGVEEWLNGASADACPDITQKISQEVKARHQLLPAQYQRKRKLPISIKTRVGFDQPAVENWIPYLLETEPAVISIHGRTLRQQYGGEANWQLIAQATQLAKESQTLIMGNGDVKSHSQATEDSTKYQLAGVLIGRASFGNPYVFRDDDFIPIDNLFEIALEHAQLYEKTYGTDPKYHFFPMRKHLGWYVRGVAEASQIRAELFKTNTATEVEKVLAQFKLL